ncbi:hypothetical protein L6452_14566 [Arctium lappa]|uniref:Uncharacterized protein n=1 Tax=Arctium lappa TaxID=4217 RepID=A0ACB9CLN1_ARCLA|nr:hypothetical protein L6452_14566 [Arctium lappa]
MQFTQINIVFDIPTTTSSSSFLSLSLKPLFLSLKPLLPWHLSLPQILYIFDESDPTNYKKQLHYVHELNPYQESIQIYHKISLSLLRFDLLWVK